MKKIVPIILIMILVFCELSVGVISISMPLSSQYSDVDDFDMVIISPDEFSNELQSLISHKNSIGVRTFLKNNEEIYLEYKGRDKAEKIKYFIFESVKHYSIKYVLIVGDINKTPIRKTEVNHIWPGDNLVQVDNIITDLYYADIFDAEGNFSSWDSNNDNVFSEFYLYNMGKNPSEIEVVDEVDLYPDVGVGRIPCSNNHELAIVINKIKSYETQSFGDWFQRLILAGEDGFPEPGYQCEIITDMVAEILKNFTTVKLYESSNTLKPRLVNKELNTGAGFFFFFAHGRHMAIANYHKSFIKGVNNIAKMPVAFIGGCYNAQLDASLHYLLMELGLAKMNNFLHLLRFNTTKLQKCIAWEFLKYENGGSIATIGSTRKGHLNREDPFSGFGGLLIIKFFESYAPGIKLSDMYMKAITTFINDTWKDYMTLQEIIILGDPSLRIGGYP